MKNLDKFLDESQSTKCPKGFRFDTKLKSCVPTKRFPYYPYGMIGRRNGESKNGNGNGTNGNGSHNGNGSNGHSGGNGNGASGGGNGGGGE